MFEKGHPAYNKKKSVPVETKPVENIVAVKEDGVLNQVETTEEVKVVQPQRPVKRTPMSSVTRLKYPKVLIKDGVRYHTHVFNDRDDRIQRARDAGYTVVLQSDLTGRDDRCGAASQMGEPVTQPVGKGTTGVLMMIPEEWYIKDENIKKEKLDVIEDSMKKPSTPAGYGKVTIEVEK